MVVQQKKIKKAKCCEKQQMGILIIMFSCCFLEELEGSLVFVWVCGEREREGNHYWMNNLCLV